MGADDDKDAAPPTTGLKMSMTMTSKPKKALGATASGFAAASELRDAEAKKESVEEVVEGNIGKDNEPVIIPGAGNTFHLGGAQHLRPGALQTSEEAEEAEMAQAEAGMSLTDESAGAPAAPTGSAAPAAAPLDEEAEAAQALLQEVRKSGGASIFGNNGKVDEAEMYRLDVGTRPDVADEEAYERMPIEMFGKAYLRGYDWKEGEGMGKDGQVVEAVEYVPRPQLLGLGAQPKEEKNHKAEKRFIKPGESREAKKDMIYVDDKGRQRHVKKLSEKLVEREKVGLVKGALVAVTAGAHKGLYGRILSIGGLEKRMRAQLKLTLNGEEVTVEAESLEPVIDAKLEKQRPGYTHAQAAQAGQSAEGGKRDRDGGREGGREERGREPERERHRDGEEREHKSHKSHKSDKHHTSDKSHKADRHQREPGASGGGGGSRGGGGSGGGGGGGGGGRTWVRENIRVRIVDKKLRGGSLYSKKGVVVDVGGADSLSVRMDGEVGNGMDGKLVEGVSASAVETALPKPGGAVLCVRGKHCNRRGRLLERNAKEGVAAVQLNETFDIIKIDFDDVAEWVGVAGEDLEDDNL